MDNETNQTWRVRMWLSNDEAFYNMARSVANRDSSEENMRSLVEEMLNLDLLEGLGLDLITYDLDCVDWESIVEDFKEEDDDD